jgi:deoxycytidylate deaminase
MPNSQISEILDRFMEDPKTTKLRNANNTLHVAVLVNRGKIIAEATNRVAFRSMNNKSFSNTFIREPRNIHAEENVVRVLGDKSKLRGSDMYIMRFGKGEHADQFINSKPCAKCASFLEKCMEKYGLRHVYYTSDLM